MTDSPKYQIGDKVIFTWGGSNICIIRKGIIKECFPDPNGYERSDQYLIQTGDDEPYLVFSTEIELDV